jgi:hypothetical protein
MPFTSTRGAASARGFGFATSPTPKVLQFSGSATSSSSTFDLSAVTANGRLCILADNSYNGTPTTPTKVIPSGFTEIISLDATGASVGIRHTISYKILNGTETTLTGQASTTRKMALVLSVQDRLITSVSISGTIGQQVVGTGTLSVQNIAATGQVAPLVLIGTYGAQSNENPAGLSGADGYLPGSASQCSLWYRIVNSGTQTATMTPASGSRAQALTSFFINVN